MALPNGRIAPWLAKKGTKYIPGLDIDVSYMYWNMLDPVWGGYTPERAAETVRKALSMAPEKDILKRAEPWRPYRATAVMYLWRSLG